MPKKTKPKIEIDIKQVEQLASRGLTLEEIAISMGFSYDTLNRRKKELRDLQDAIKRGQTSATTFVANKLFKKISEEDTTCIIFYLKCHGWHEKSKEEVQVKAEHEVVLRWAKPEEENR